MGLSGGLNGIIIPQRVERNVWLLVKHTTCFSIVPAHKPSPRCSGLTHIYFALESILWPGLRKDHIPGEQEGWARRKACPLRHLPLPLAAGPVAAALDQTPTSDFPTGQAVAGFPG